MHDEHKGGGDHMHCHLCGPMKKEFKLALLEKKEKILKTELEFIGKMKELIEKIPEQAT